MGTMKRASSLPVWDLSSLRPKDVDRALQAIEIKVKKVENARDDLKSISPAGFFSLLKELEAIKAEASRIGSYAHLWHAEDSSNEKAQSLVARIQQFLVAVENRLLFVSLWFKDLPPARARAYIDRSEAFSYHLEQIRKAKPYTLSEKEERVINILDATGSSALANIYTTITTQLSFSYRGREVSQNRLLALVRDPSPRVRRDAYIALLARYAKEKDVLGQIYRDLVLAWREENLTLRGYQSPIHVRNFSNDIPDRSVDALLAVCERNQALFQRFFEIKRKRLGLATMRRFDLYAQLRTREKRTSYRAAIARVLDAYSSFSPVFKSEAKKIITHKHVHARLQKNKNPGAFCAGVSLGMTPFVLLNYERTPRDVSTIAHEFGHGIHFLLAQGNTEFTYDACLPLAETASIFGEMLLMERLKEKDPRAREELLFLKLEDIYASIIRQAGFVAFEKQAHSLFSQGKTIQEVSQVYLDGLRRQLGRRVDVDDLFCYEWLYIPHIFQSPFYCYAYAFGNLLVLALWGQYQKEGASFVPKMLGFLEKGGSESPAAITREIGIDISSEACWQEGFSVVEKMLSELEDH